MTPIDPQELASRYVAIWNQPDAELPQGDPEPVVRL